MYILLLFDEQKDSFSSHSSCPLQTLYIRVCFGQVCGRLLMLMFDVDKSCPQNGHIKDAALSWGRTFATKADFRTRFGYYNVID